VRYINIEDVGNNLPAGWKEKAQEALQNVKALRPTERSTAINSKSEVWKELKEVLKGFSKGKCWYCESRQERSDNPVDHFRPKNKVAECSDHYGYWWLAFDWTNYRFSCTFCNSYRIDQTTGTRGGKHDHFPLWNEDRRAKQPGDPLDNEQPLLLDPTCRADPPLLWFDQDGRPKPNPQFCSDESSYPHKRVMASIKFYHLDHVDAVEQRQNLSNEIRKLVENAAYYFKKLCDGDMTARKSFADIIEAIHNKLRIDAEYSAAARATLMGLRGTYPVTEIILSAA
jgi:uncharacterized protein (TIGR02646 family)